ERAAPGPFGSWLLALRVVDKLPDPLWREWQMAGLDREALQRIGNGIADRAADRDQPALARSLGAERVVRARPQSKRDRAWRPEIGRCRQQVIGKRPGQKLAIAVIGKLFQKGAAKALIGGAQHLAIERCR